MAVVLLILTSFQLYRPKAEVAFDPQIISRKEPIPVWVFFTDKGFQDEQGLTQALVLNAARDFDDLPLTDHYIDQVIIRGGILRHRSKWLNGASFWIRPDLIPGIAQLPFVYRIAEIKPAVVREPYYPSGPTEEPDSSYYGYTYLQNKMFNIDKVHGLGVYGSGIRIGILDTGFKRKHAALRDVKIAKEWDFLSGDHLFRYRISTGRESLYIDPIGLTSGLTGVTWGDTVDLFLVGDTIYSSLYPTREVFEILTTDGTFWSEPSDISENHYSRGWISDPQVVGTDSIEVVWSVDRGVYDLYSRLKVNNTWQPKVLVKSTGTPIREPNLHRNSDTTFLIYVFRDSSLILTWNYPSTPESTVVFAGGHKVYNPAITSVADTFVVTSYTKFPDSILISRSTDRGRTFSTTPILKGFDPVIKCDGSDLYLLFKDSSGEPVIRLAYSVSQDRGVNWSAPVYIDSATSFGGTDLEIDQSVVNFVYETRGNIYMANSSSWNPTLIDSPNVYLPHFIGNDIYYVKRGDNNTDYDPITDRLDQPDHGTRMLGLIGGLVNGLYVGVAFGAEFLIAKTERTGMVSTNFYEFPVEEDTWIEGLEWLEKNGARIISSSLAYIDWYDYEDLDGKTAPISIAARKAAERGLVIVNAIGNRPDTVPPHPTYITAPGDAPGIITVGGVQPDSSYAPIAGFGPTVDGRMKPELSALAKSWIEEQKGVIVVNPDTTSEYLFSGGTSTATALVAGICALILEGHPSWKSDSLLSALFETASLHNSPNDTLGYGTPDAYAALFYTEPILDSITRTQFLPPFPNPFLPDQHQYLYFPFFIALKRAQPTLSIFSLDGRLIARIEREEMLAPGRYDQKDPNHPSAAFSWDGRTDSGQEVPSGIYIGVIHDGFGADRCKFAIVR
ncbi:MAG TPA: hypothetical protein EYP58_04815 [bacterium (Candidatus Stahlbacteria)]|nr:hypothetical protein [Candidatus Stahlbacteria bacterium]